MAVKKIVLCDGEYIVSSSGNYVFAHYYRHPVTGRRVVLTGMDHYGSPAYYAAVKKILAPCDLVLFEDIVPERLAGDRKEEYISRTLQTLFHGSLNEAAVAAQGDHLYCLLLGHPYEGDFFGIEYGQRNWVNADLFKDVEVERQEMEREKDAIRKLPVAAKRSIVLHTRRIVRRILQGRFTVRDFMRDFSFREAWCDRWEGSEDVDFSRNTHCFEEFYRLILERDPSFIGIKFGAGHMKAMRDLLEERGYVYQRSKKLRPFRWSKSMNL